MKTPIFLILLVTLACPMLENEPIIFTKSVEYDCQDNLVSLADFYVRFNQDTLTICSENYQILNIKYNQDHTTNFTTIDRTSCASIISDHLVDDHTFDDTILFEITFK